MSEGPDLLIERVRSTLREAPGTVPDPRRVAQLLSVVWESPEPSALRRWLDAWRVPSLSGVGATVVAGIALFAGFLTRGAVDERRAPEPFAATGSQTGEFPVQFASATLGETAPVLTQFVLDDAKAQRVSLVGDFNDWAAGATPLTRLESGVWTVSVPLPPGRHVYAFLVDDTLLVTDPRAPKSGDADYGREGSVVMVFAR
ncbi:MAG: isoamylase early set domain-containing protein [Gemmatimonadetes bacterium]|nr:isoamylase early set domain-containing protein [Gemmatimonadota bacterium]